MQSKILQDSVQSQLLDLSKIVAFRYLIFILLPPLLLSQREMELNIENN